MADVLLLGVDGGNTKTESLVARSDGIVLGFSRVLGVADIYQARSPEAALDVIEASVRDALAAAGADRSQLGAAGFSLAGADWPEDFALHDVELRARFPGVRFRLTNDGIGALYAIVPEGPGVVVAVGTGAATGGRGPTGATWHSSFWQEAQGGHELAEAAAHAVYRAELGTGPATSLRRRVLDFFGVDSVEEALHRHTRRDGGIGRVDPLAGPLLEEAEGGDPVACAIVASHGQALGDYAVVAARKVGIDLDAPFPLALTGGVFAHRGHVLCDALVARVRESAPHVQPLRTEIRPVVGAVVMAAESAALPPTALWAAVRHSLAATTAPPAPHG